MRVSKSRRSTSLSSEQKTVAVGNSQSTDAKALFKNPILLLEILDAVELTAVDPTAEQEQLEHPD
jgi:hypothetical protein